MQHSTKNQGHCGAIPPMEICEIFGHWYPFTGKEYSSVIFT